jgi:hypothetical protein
LPADSIRDFAQLSSGSLLLNPVCDLLDGLNDVLSILGKEEIAVAFFPGRLTNETTTQGVLEKSKAIVCLAGIDIGFHIADNQTVDRRRVVHGLLRVVHGTISFWLEKISRQSL